MNWIEIDDDFCQGGITRGHRGRPRAFTDEIRIWLRQARGDCLCDLMFISFWDHECENPQLPEVMPFHWLYEGLNERDFHNLPDSFKQKIEKAAASFKRRKEKATAASSNSIRYYVKGYRAS